MWHGLGLALVTGLGGTADESPWLVDAAADSGLHFQWNSGHDAAFLMPEVVGGGVALLDYDGDGDLDLAVTQFGYLRGEVQWLENLGDWQFRGHHLMDKSGGIHGPIVDIDNDGDLDIVVLFSQEWESVHAFVNDGTGAFAPTVLHDVADADYSSSGIDVGDIDGDGDADIAWANGDAFVSVDYRPLPSHGVQWLENRGDLDFAFHR
ncbi:MAG: FG-GAP-like repeat-containing protein, partial [Phycisphaerales bacterium]|nr:FG-GAP-like repeat-containing protein [Phycisphaerales bacterium]